jgi:hypothetical protein
MLWRPPKNTLFEFFKFFSGLFAPKKNIFKKHALFYEDITDKARGSFPQFMIELGMLISMEEENR